jgi:hypothetical protein
VLRHSLKPALKRGALIAAANWQVAFVQAAADTLFKALVAAPIIGGIFLAALAVGSDPQSLFVLDWRDLAATIVSSLLSRPLVLVAFLLAVGVVAIGGSLFVFLIKAGTVAVLVRSERDAGPIEEPPLHVDAVARAGRFSIDFFIEASRSLYPRYARLGFMLMAVYLMSGAAYLAFLLLNRTSTGGWSVTALVSAGFVGWITIVNFLYLLVQIVIAADDTSVLVAVRRVAAFLRHERRQVISVFLLLLLVVVVATTASLAAAAALALIAFVPFFWLAALPLNLLAWLLRALVFQYLGLASIGAYLKLYRGFSVSGLTPARRFAGLEVGAGVPVSHHE